MARGRRLAENERGEIAATAARRYHNGESWAQIAKDYELTSTYVHRLTTARHTIHYRRWGQRAIADVNEVLRRRDEGQTLNEIAKALDCSRQAVRTALERAGRTPTTRYPELAQRRTPTPTEISTVAELYEACPQAPRNREGSRHIRGDEGRTLAEACRALVDDGVPMANLSRSLGRGPTWVHWLLSCHDLRPEPHEARTTSRRTRLVSQQARQATGPDATDASAP